MGEMEKVNWPNPNHTVNSGTEYSMSNSQLNTWTKMPIHLSRSVSLSFIYYPFEDGIQQMYHQKNLLHARKMVTSLLHVY